MKAELNRQQGDIQGSTDYFTKVLSIQPRHLAARLGRIDNSLNSNLYDDARADLDFVERQAAGNPLVSYLWAKYYARTGDMDSASNRLQQAERLIPDHLPTVYLRAVVAYSQNNLEQAHHNLTRVLEAAPRDVGARRLMAATLVRQGDAGKAIPLLKSLIADGVADANVYTLLARAEMETHDYAAATESFDAAIKQSDDPSALKTQRALSKLAQGAEDEALQDLQSVVNEDEDSLQARVLLVMLALRDRDYQTALSQADDIVKQFPDNPLAENMRGAALIGLNRLDDAHAAFSAALETDPDYMPAAIYLARLETQMGEVDSAVQRYETLLAKDPGNVNALVDLSNIKLSQGDQDAAIDYLERAMNARPDVTGPGLRLVNLYIGMNEPGKALSEANVLLQNHRDDPQVLEMAGRAQLAAGETANSIQSFRRLTNILPNSGPARFLLGVSLRQSGDTDGAKEAFRKAIELTPAFAPSYQSLVSLEAESGNLEGALELAEDLRTSMPDSPVGDVFTGDIYLRRNEPQKAIEAFDAAWSKTRQFPVAVRLYRAHSALGNPDSGLELMQQWVDEHPKDAGAKSILASSYLDSGKYSEAITAYEALITPDSQDAVALNNLAWLYQQVGDSRDVQTARAAYDLQPGVAAIADTYGWILLSSGQKAEALPILQKAATMAPASADIRYHFAKALAENGKKEAALREAQSILGLSGGSETLQKVQALISELK
jgi:putative PEP-CTERM system TPR-repeat lipoprotein